MDQTQQKAHAHPYGSTVIGGVLPRGPLGTSFVISMQPEQLQADGRIPQHAGSVSVTVGGDVTPPTSADKLATMIGGFLDQLVEHIADRVHDKVVAGVKSVVDAVANEDAKVHGMPRPFDPEDLATDDGQALHALGDMLDERGISNLNAVDEQLVIKMLILDGAPGKRHTFVTWNGTTFEIAFDQEPVLKLDLLATVELLTERAHLTENNKAFSELFPMAAAKGGPSQR